jgi:hypothetical protein
MKYREIISHYEDCLKLYGDSHLGVDWPVEGDVIKRYRVMLDIIREGNEYVSLMDFGCGAAHLYDYIKKNNMSRIEYSGLDASEKFIELCKNKYPLISFRHLDIIQDGADFPEVDYIIMNGVFTEKRSMSFEEMFEYFSLIIKRIYIRARKGVAFNVMSKHVDWEREDLFHVPFDKMAIFINKNFGRNFIIRNDYGLYEYTVYIYRQPYEVI